MITQADKEAAALHLGYRDWDDANDYRLSGEAMRLRDRTVAAFARHREAAAAPLREALRRIVELTHDERSFVARQSNRIAFNALKEADNG